ncbi:hypothetical protein [Herbiconiux daphne]|uniref:DUF4261 domain-containing protein n=1 Tax=Herbiconiux daphne TaxID=2970914 RepID=A0ABT2H1T7_9MICO|nr:hypothetical protein [Herbiconiux daphne]MCS5733923.1 hypothetical protein [Herbiconiux daphne]
MFADDVIRLVLGTFESLVLRPRPPSRIAAAAALRGAYRACYGRDPEYVIAVPSPRAGAFAVGLIPLLHDDALGLRRAPADEDAERQISAVLVDDVAAQLSSQARNPAAALPRHRLNAPELALWSRVYVNAERFLGQSLLERCYLGATFAHTVLRWDDNILRQLEADIPADWFEYRDVRSVNDLCDARFIDVLGGLGVPGLEAWGPFVQVGDLVDHFWMRPGYLVHCDPPVSGKRRVDADGEAVVDMRWADGWTVRFSPAPLGQASVPGACGESPASPG